MFARAFAGRAGGSFFLSVSEDVLKLYARHCRLQGLVGVYRDLAEENRVLTEMRKVLLAKIAQVEVRLRLHSALPLGFEPALTADPLTSSSPPLPGG